MYTTVLCGSKTHLAPACNATRWHGAAAITTVTVRCSSAPQPKIVCLGRNADVLSANGPRYHHRRRAGTRRELRPLTKLRCTACKRTRPADLRRHRCDCWTRGPTAEAPTPSGSIHRDAPAVKARESRCSHRSDSEVRCSTCSGRKEVRPCPEKNTVGHIVIAKVSLTSRSLMC